MLGKGLVKKRQSCLLLLSLHNSFLKMKFKDNITFISVKYFHLKKLKRLYLMGDNDKL